MLLTLLSNVARQISADSFVVMQSEIDSTSPDQCPVAFARGIWIRAEGSASLVTFVYQFTVCELFSPFLTGKLARVFESVICDMREDHQCNAVHDKFADIINQLRTGIPKGLSGAIPPTPAAPSPTALLRDPPTNASTRKSDEDEFDRRTFVSQIVDGEGRASDAHWKLSQVIGQGSMGRVYLAMDMTRGRQFAVKMVSMTNGSFNVQDVCESYASI
jgi:hypothetical protein